MRTNRLSAVDRHATAPGSTALAAHRRRARSGSWRGATAIVVATVVATLAGAPAAGAVTVDMQQLVMAAQLDQYRPNSAPTAGAADDVKRVQRVLRAKRYQVKVDGSFGATTIAAYAGWQRKLGASGLGANGIPGPESLRRLGLTIANPVVAPGPRKTFSGVTLNTRTIAMLKAAGQILGCTVDVTKGSFKGPDAASAGTHAGGGAVDISVKRGGCGTPKAMVAAMRTVGFAAWHRHTGSFVNNKHIHAVAISDLDMATEAAFPGQFDMREQVVAWAQGRDGLSAAVVAPMTREPLQTWEAYKRAN